jgi:hypothetical protein
MDTYTPALQRGFVAIPSPWSLKSAANDDAASTRSANNIRQWRSYLPEDCITTMIQMGWDLST